MQVNRSEENQLVSMLGNLSIQESPSKDLNVPKPRQEGSVVQLTKITDAIVDDINKLIVFLRKGKQPGEVGHFPISHQQRSEQWHDQRRIRLTGSMFKTYIHAMPVTRLKMPFDSFHQQSKQIHSKAMEYGVKFEQVAREEYSKLFPEYIVKDATLSIKTSEPWLGSSPDGLIYDSNDRLIGGLEIKCPYSKKDMTVQQAIKINDFYLKQPPKSEVELDVKHTYYYQVQGQMLVLDLPWVDFVVRTEKNIKVVKVLRNEVFIDYLRKELRGYYFENYIWEVLKQYAKSEYLETGTKYWMGKERTLELLGKVPAISSII